MIAQPEDELPVAEREVDHLAQAAHPRAAQRGAGGAGRLGGDRLERAGQALLPVLMPGLLACRCGCGGRR